MAIEVAATSVVAVVVATGTRVSEVEVAIEVEAASVVAVVLLATGT